MVPVDPDTDIGGPLHKFPATNHSAIINARSDDQLVRGRAFDIILANGAKERIVRPEAGNTTQHNDDVYYPCWEEEEEEISGS